MWDVLRLGVCGGCSAGFWKGRAVAGPGVTGAGWAASLGGNEMADELVLETKGMRQCAAGIS